MCLLPFTVIHILPAVDGFGTFLFTRRHFQLPLVYFINFFPALAANSTMQIYLHADTSTSKQKNFKRRRACGFWICFYERAGSPAPCGCIIAIRLGSNESIDLWEGCTFFHCICWLLPAHLSVDLKHCLTWGE